MSDQGILERNDIKVLDREQNKFHVICYYGDVECILTLILSMWGPCMLFHWDTSLKQFS